MKAVGVPPAGLEVYRQSFAGQICSFKECGRILAVAVEGEDGLSAFTNPLPIEQGHRFVHLVQEAVYVALYPFAGHDGGMLIPPR